jgi:hypothetical protein
MSEERGSDYISYLLRLWRTSTDGQAVWRASLTDPLTAERIGFADLDALFEFLRRQTAPHSCANGSGDKTEP